MLASCPFYTFLAWLPDTLAFIYIGRASTVLTSYPGRMEGLGMRLVQY